jgi:hypothetical protein
MSDYPVTLKMKRPLVAGGRTVVSVPEMATGCLRRLVLKPVMGWPRMEEVRELVTVALAVATEVLKVVAESLKCLLSCL